MPHPDVAIVSASIGGYDRFQAQTPQDIPVEWVAFTDEPKKRNPWRMELHTPNGAHPNLQAKRYKLQPPLPHRYVIWVDANIRIESPSFAREALTYIQDGLAVHRHPFRDCIYQEALESIFTPKYDHLPIPDQIRHYRLAERFPPHNGLYACGVIAWDTHTREAHRLGKAWMKECERWGFQDQIAFPVVCRRLGITPGVFPHNQYASPWLRVLPRK